MYARWWHSQSFPRLAQVTLATCVLACDEVSARVHTADDVILWKRGECRSRKSEQVSLSVWVMQADGQAGRQDVALSGFSHTVCHWDVWMVGVNLNILHARKGVIRRGRKRRKSHASMLCLRSYSVVLGFQSAVTHYSPKPKASLLGGTFCAFCCSLFILHV